ncbi:MAG: hypothetical protein KDB80_17880 [Planctomycetes bacterium]|nr:hypothetical protein [Planctomycetota bacterium]
MLARAKFRLSLIVGAAILVAAHIALANAECAPIGYFASDMFAERYRGLRDRNAERPVELIAIGSSHVTNGFDAERFAELSGIRAYNFGIPSSDVHFQALVLRDLLIPRFRPKYVLWEVDEQIQSAFESNVVRIESQALRRAALPFGAWLVAGESLLLQHQRRSVPEWIETIDVPRDFTYDEYGFLYGYGRLDLKNAGEKRERRPRGAPRQSRWKRWFQQRSLAMQLPDPYDSEERYVESEPFPEETVLAAIASALDTAAEYGVEVRAFTTPFHRTRYRKRKGFGPQMREYYAWLGAQFEAHGVEYANYRFTPGISDDGSLFADDVHLNGDGADLLTPLIYEHLFAPNAKVPDEYSEFRSQAEKDAYERYDRKR